MIKFMSYIKKNIPSLYALTISFFLALWYNGIAGLLNHYLPNRGLFISSILMIIPLIIFLTDDGHLDELYKPPEIPVTTASQNTT